MRIWPSPAAILVVLGIQLTSVRATGAPSSEGQGREAPPTAPSGYHLQEARPQVALDVTPPDSPIVPLLCAELRELGVDVADGPPGSATTVTMHIVLTSELLEVRIVDQTTGRTTERETFSVIMGSPMDPRTAVLHAVELLRWDLRFTPAATDPTALHTPPSASTPARPSSPSPTSNMRIGLIPFALYSPGGAGVSLGGQVDILKRWGRLGARVLGGSVFLPSGVSVPEGSIEATASWGGVAGVLIVGGDRRTSLEVGLGATIFASALHGKANADNLGKDDHLLTVAPLGEFRLRQRVTPGFALSLDSAFFVPLRSSRLLVLDREVGRFGQVVMTLGLGVELALF